jgi:UDP-N-acetylglucosamine enolpyruvyl transferase
MPTSEGLVGTQVNFDLDFSYRYREYCHGGLTLAKGITTINNAAQEPEVTDLI